MMTRVGNQEREEVRTLVRGEKRVESEGKKETRRKRAFTNFRGAILSERREVNREKGKWGEGQLRRGPKNWAYIDYTSELRDCYKKGLERAQRNWGPREAGSASFVKESAESGFGQRAGHRTRLLESNLKQREPGLAQKKERHHTQSGGTRGERGFSSFG